VKVEGRIARMRRELEDLYQERFGDFVRVATAITGSESQGIDAVQETFARALASLNSFRAEGPLAAWLWRILVNTARSQKPTGLLGDESELSLLESTNGYAADDLGVRRWIAALPERQRLVVFLRHYADLDYGAIAAALDIELGTVSATLSAAHRALRRLMEKVPR
jgi:RNA polymerase sigma-70 factor (ECF subfamily)